MRLGSYLLLCLSFWHLASANEIYRPKSVSDYGDKVIRNEMQRVQGAKVAWADFEAIKRDFPEVRKYSDWQIEQWILDEFAYVSKIQSKLSGIRNTPIPASPGKSKLGICPVGYGETHKYKRAAVMQTGLKSGMVDVKGTGHYEQNPAVNYLLNEYRNAQGNLEALNRVRALDHSDGLMSLGEAIAEMTRQQAAQRLFDIHNATHGTRLQTVESYFIIALPVDILKPGDVKIPAALYGRQAHFGRQYGLSVPSEIYQDNFGKMQSSYFGSAVDFGGVEITESNVKHNYDNVNAGEAFDAQKSKPWDWGHRVAESWRKGDTQAINRHRAEMLAPLDEKWAKVPHGITRELEKFADKPFVEQMEALLSEGSPESKNIAIRALEGRDDPKSLSLLVQKLKTDKSVAKSASVALCSHRHPDAAKQVLTILSSTPPPDIDVINIIGSHLSARKEREWLPVIKKGLSLSSRFSSALDGWTSPESINLLKFALGHESLEVRTSVVNALGQRSDPESFELIRKAFNDRVSDVRIAAVRALGSRKDLRALELFEQLMSNADEDMRHAAVVSLKNWSMPEAENKKIELLCRGLKDPEIKVAWDLISMAGDDRYGTLPMVQEAGLRSPHKAVRNAFIERFKTEYKINPDLTELAVRLLKDNQFSYVDTRGLLKEILSQHGCLREFLLKTIQ